MEVLREQSVTTGHLSRANDQRVPGRDIALSREFERREHQPGVRADDGGLGEAGHDLRRDHLVERSSQATGRHPVELRQDLGAHSQWIARLRENRPSHVTLGGLVPVVRVDRDASGEKRRYR